MNVEKLSERVITIKDPLMTRFAKSAYRLLDELDREVARDGRISLFVYLRKVCSLMAPRFDEKAISEMLELSFGELDSKLRGDIQNTSLIEALGMSLNHLIKRGTNPKFDYIEQMIVQHAKDDEAVGIVWRGSKWLTFDTTPYYQNIRSDSHVISFDRDLPAMIDIIYTPMPLIKLKNRLANHFLLNGVCREINSVLYSFESNPVMLIPDFIAADDGSVCKLVEIHRLPGVEYFCDDPLEVEVAVEFVEPQSEIESASDSSDVVQILMESGLVATLDKNNQVWVIRESDGDLTFEEEWPDLLDEGDCLIFVREHYVDSTDTLMEAEWRLALASLLTVRDVSEVCDEMAIQPSSRPSETTVRSWASGKVYGPADFKMFDTLIDILIENKTLSREAAVKSKGKWWNHLEATRADQRNQGLAARRRLIEDIKNSLTEAFDEVQSTHGFHTETILATQLSGIYGRGELGYLSGTGFRIMQ